MKISRGLRNNNPLNIRRNRTKWKGLSIEQKDSDFFVFMAPCWGYRAAFITLSNYKRLHKLDTLADWINRWAPPVENDTKSYIAFVSRKSGIDPYEKIDISDKTKMCKIVSAMSHMENGVQAKTIDVEKGWDLSGI